MNVTANTHKHDLDANEYCGFLFSYNNNNNKEKPTPPVVFSMELYTYTR